ncbi:MAG TPA: hypothetical protein VI455_07205 [Terriglobia bacterium]
MTPDRNAWQDADRLANVVWCRATRQFASGTSSGRVASMALSMGTKPESLTKQTDSQYRVSSGQWERSALGKPSVVSRSPYGQTEGRVGDQGRPASFSGLGCHLGGEPRLVRFKYGVRDDWRRIGLIFWVQRKAYCTLGRIVRVLVGAETPFPPAGDQGLEQAVRSKAFRLQKPNPRERWRFSLDADGNPDWTKEPWKSARARVEVAERSLR